MDFRTECPQPPRLVPVRAPRAVIPKSGKKAKAGLVCVSCERTDAQLKKMDGKDYPKNYVFFDRDTKQTLRLDWSIGYGQLVCVECSENAYQEEPCRFCGIPIECCPVLSKEDYDNICAKKHIRHCGIQLRLMGQGNFDSFEAVIKPAPTPGPMDVCDKCLLSFGPTYYQGKVKSPDAASQDTTPKVGKVAFHPEPAVEVFDDVRVAIEEFEDDSVPSVVPRFETPRFEKETLGDDEAEEDDFAFAPLTRTRTVSIRPDTSTPRNTPLQSI